MQRNRIRKYVFFYLLPLSCGISLVADSKMELNDTAIRFGSVNANLPLKADFILQNKGNSDLKISMIRSTCPCVKTEFPKRISPGESGRIQLNIAPNSYLGDFSGKLYVISNDPASPKELLFNGYAKPLYHIQPSAESYLGKWKNGTQIRKEFKIQGERNIVWGKAQSKGTIPAETKLISAGKNNFKLHVSAK